VTIKGTNFNEVDSVKFGSSAASYEVLSGNIIKALSPPGTGTVDIVVETRGGATAAVGADHFTYTARPGITGVTPNHGPPSGGTRVTITGTSFTGATEVRFGSTEARSFKVESENQITVVSPAFSGGDASMPIFVTSPGGTSEYECGEEEVGFVYEPIVTGVEPNSGPPAGGTEVTIRGADFWGLVLGKEPLCIFVQNVVSWVYFGSTPAKSINVLSGSEITAVAPPGTGTVHVRVQGVVSESPIAPADQFSYGTPVIDGESVSGITEHGATLEAQIDPIGHETEYELWLECDARCDPGLPEQVGAGHVPAGDPERTVSVGLSNLQPGASYTYWALATSSEGKTEAPHEPFDALPPSSSTMPPPSTGPTQPGGSVFTTGCCTQPGQPSLGAQLAFSGLSLAAVQHGRSLVAQITIGNAGSRVEVDATAPAVRVVGTGKRRKRRPVVLARLVRPSVSAGRLRLTVPLDTRGERELERHGHLALSVRIRVTPPAGKPRIATSTVILASGSLAADLGEGPRSPNPGQGRHREMAL
jgi:hypothetical protein